LALFGVVGPADEPGIGPTEEVAADDQGNVYAGFTAPDKTAVRKFVKNRSRLRQFIEADVPTARRRSRS
jgi:hypothetical protein